jgi:U1 small nuclear ribonucleoprotein C
LFLISNLSSISSLKPSVRKTHFIGRKHRENVRDYYQKWMEDQTQSLIDKTTAAFKTGKIAPKLPPGFGMPPMGMGMPPFPPMMHPGMRPPPPFGMPGKLDLVEIR